MKIIIDTNSLLSLVRYYLPFDKENVLYNLIREKIENSEMIIIDAVFTQCNYISKGIILEKLEFLKDKSFLKKSKTPFKTETLIIPNPKKFFHLLNNNFVNHTVKRQKKITDAEFENEKENYLKDADMRLIISSLNYIAENEDVILVTEETATSNDNKLFKKLPSICADLNIKSISLPQLIEILGSEIKLNISK